MVGKALSIPIEISKDDMDEGWWASVLADEESAMEDFSDLAPVSGQSADMILVDWDRVRSIYENDEIVSLQVYGYNRGGLLVQEEGIQGFVPVSHLIEMPCGVEEEARKSTLSEYVGRTLMLKVIECEPSLDRVVLSERAAQAGEGRRKQLFNSLKVGDVVKGKVTNVTDFGVFIDLGGVEGLIHVSELSWGRVQHPGDILKIGECAEAMVLQINEDTSRVALSFKRLQSNPWEVVASNYTSGDEVDASVTTITRFGVFARLDEGIEGLIHISSIELESSTQTLETMFFPGKRIRVQILHIDPDRRRLGLGYIQN